LGGEAPRAGAQSAGQRGLERQEASPRNQLAAAAAAGAAAQASARIALREPEPAGGQGNGAAGAEPASPPRPPGQEEAAPAARSVAGNGVSEEQVAEIRNSVAGQQKFLGELLEHGHRWEVEASELRIYFSAEKRAFAEMVEGRESLEKIR